MKLKKKMKNRKEILNILVSILMAVAVFLFLSLFQVFEPLELQFRDILYQKSQKATPDSNIIIVSISDSSLKNLNASWPINRQYYLKFLQQIASSQPSVIAFDLLFFNQAGGSDLSIENQICQLIREKNLKVIFASAFNQYSFKNDEQENQGALITELNQPINDLLDCSQSGFINIPNQRDDKIRQYNYFRQYQGYWYPSFSAAVFLAYYQIDQYQLNQNSQGYLLELNPAKQLDIPSDEKLRTYIHFTSLLTEFPVYDFYEILSGKETLPRNKIVLVGADFNDSKDIFLTPFSNKTGYISGINIQANALNNLLNPLFIQELPLILQWIFALLLLLINFLIWRKYSPKFSVFYTFLTLVLILSISFFLFHFHLMIFNSITLLGFILINAICFSTIRYIGTFKEKMQLLLTLEKQNKILAQTLQTLKETQEEKIRMEKLSTIGKMANYILHDLKVPLQNILTSSEMIEISSSANSYTREIQEEVQVIKEMILDVADFSKDHLQLRLTEFSLKDLITNIRKRLSYLITEKKIQFIEHYELNHFYGDREKIERILLNLIKNAIESIHHPEGIIQISLTEKKGWSELKVSDNGPGIEPEDLEKIFQPFFSQKKQGLGLGLSIVEHIVKQLQGEIKVDSLYGKGTKFRIMIPKKTT